MKELVYIWLLTALVFNLFGNFTPQANATPSGNIYGEQITTTINPLLVDIDSEERIFVIADDGKVCRSTDRGSTWTEVKDSGVESKSLYVDSRDYLFVKYAGNMHRSTNHGDSWSNCSGWNDAGMLWHWDEDFNGYIYTNNYHDSGYDYIYRSTDQGASWSVWYNVSATSNPVRHIHSVRVAPNDYVYVMTGDDTTEADDNTIRRYNGTAWETFFESQADAEDYREGRLCDMFFMNNYAWTCGDGGIFAYRFPYSVVSGNEWNQREKILRYETFPDSEGFDSLVIDSLAFVATANGKILGSWDGLHWVKVYEMTDANAKIMRMSSRESFPIYWVDDNNHKLYRINRISKEDLVQLFYKTYNAERGSVTNANPYVLQQRIYNRTNHLDLTQVGLSNVQVSIVGLSKKNQLSNDGFETGDTTSWVTSSGGGTHSVVSDEQYNGTYSFKAVKSATDSSYANIYQTVTIQRGDTIIINFAVKSNDTMNAGTTPANSPISLSIYNASELAMRTVYYGSTTSWRTISYNKTFNSQTSWSLTLRIHFGRLNLTTWLDSVLVRFPETSYQGDVGDESIFYNPELFANSTYFSGTENTINPTITINSQQVSHSGELRNGTESSATNLIGILTGAVQVDANIQGGRQAILKITGTRIVHVTNAVLQAHEDSVCYGRYYDTPTFNAGTNLVALTSKQANITSTSYVPNKLNLTINSLSGTTSTTLIYVGDKGEPTSVSGATTWSYNNETKIVTTNILHTGPQEITLYWTDLNPPTTTIHLTGVQGNKGWFTSNVIVTLSATDDISGVNQTEYNFDNTTWTTYTTPFTVSTEGYTIVYYKSTDRDANAETTKTETIKIDKTVPSGSITINNGDAYTTSNSVTLTLTSTDATSSVYQIRYSNDGVWDTEPWEIPLPTRTWTLSSVDGTKTVYCQIKDNAGLVSGAHSDTTILDTAPPTGSMTINDGATYVNSLSVTLTLSAEDTTSDVAQMHFSNDGINWSDWEPYTTSKTWTLTIGDGTKTVYIEFMDNAGLISQYQDTIILDTTQPTQAFPMWAIGVIVAVIGAVLVITLLISARAKEA